ncbi:MAG: hypothetical protein ACK4N5_19750, partial [Myxococcales bacterium]
MAPRTEWWPRAAGVVLLALLAPVAALAEPGLIVRADRERVQLGRDEQVTLRVEVPEGAQSLRLFASRGVVGEPVAAGPNVFEATYLPPKQKFPQIAVVAAVADSPSGAIHGALTLPLWGEGIAVVKTRPRGQVLLRIGDATFGPAIADDTGTSTTTVVVPPGVAHAYHGERAIDLHIPDYPRVLLVPERTAVSIDAARTVEARLYAVEADG